ncbi:MAG: hypothetical protein Ta2E_02030 [Mycoplasmoidaceae bacterium]|nr:MAG: hypothetical protein Ta2E_02030 [Mycoplasmoidaceae bacterium]
MIDGCFYILQRYDHRKHHQDIYKIGRTIDYNRRLNEYPCCAQIISVVPVYNEKHCERELIKEFKSEFDWRNDICNEYFEFNQRDMISVFHDYCSYHLPNKEEEIDADYHRQIEDQRLAAERNQRRIYIYITWSFIFCLIAKTRSYYTFLF